MWVWGWHVSLTGLVNYAGGKHCVKINSKVRLCDLLMHVDMHVALIFLNFSRANLDLKHNQTRRDGRNV